ncbi:hypothetical protein ACROYT_G037293 [Oculina patagonica]
MPILPIRTQEYDESGKRITFYPDSLMMATNPRPLIFFNDTKLVSIHTDLKTILRGATPKLNISCDPVQTPFYANILDSVSSIQRTTHRLHSLQGVTSLLECDSFLRRFYQYSTGIPSQMFCPTRHYANSLQECKSWARLTCRVSAPDELAWLREQCHYPSNMEFLSLYSLQVNRAMSAMLRLTEIEDVLRPLSRLTRKTLVSFADLPRFLTTELNVRLATIPTLVHTLDALKSGFATIIQPLVDYEFQQNKKLQLNLLFTLPEIASSKSLCDSRTITANYLQT